MIIKSIRPYPGNNHPSILLTFWDASYQKSRTIQLHMPDGDEWITEPTKKDLLRLPEYKTDPDSAEIFRTFHMLEIFSWGEAANQLRKHLEK